MRRARLAYSAAHSVEQHDTCAPPGPAIGKPSLAPMNTTTACGWSLRDLALGQLRPVDDERVGDRRADVRVLDDVHLAGQPLSEVLVERLGQRVAGHQQPRQGPTGRCRQAERRRIERVGGDRRRRAAHRRHGGGEAREARHALVGGQPRGGVAGRRGRARGRRRSRRPDARTAGWPSVRYRGSSPRRPCGSTGPTRMTSSTTVTPTEMSASRARKRRAPRAWKRDMRLSSECWGGPRVGWRRGSGRSCSEAKVDERRDALAGHGRADEHDQDGKPGARAGSGWPGRSGRGPRASRSMAAVAARWCRPRRAPRGRSTAWGRSSGQARQERADQAQAGRAEQDPAEDDQVEGDEPAQPGGRMPARVIDAGSARPPARRP